MPAPSVVPAPGGGAIGIWHGDNYVIDVRLRPDGSFVASRYDTASTDYEPREVVKSRHFGRELLEWFIAPH